MNGIYTIETNNVNALMDYVHRLGRVQSFDIHPYFRNGEVWHSVSFVNLELPPDHLLQDVHLCPKYQLGDRNTPSRYTVFDNSGVVLERFGALFYAVYSIHERMIKGIFLFGCLPWDDNPITFVQDGKPAGSWFIPIWEDQVVISKDHFVSCSLFDFSLQRINFHPDLILSRKASRLALELNGVELYDLIEIKGFCY